MINSFVQILHLVTLNYMLLLAIILAMQKSFQLYDKNLSEVKYISMNLRSSSNVQCYTLTLLTLRLGQA